MKQRKDLSLVVSASVKSRLPAKGDYKGEARQVQATPPLKRKDMLPLPRSIPRTPKPEKNCKKHKFDHLSGKYVFPQLIRKGGGHTNQCDGL